MPNEAGIFIIRLSILSIICLDLYSLCSEGRDFSYKISSLTA